MANIVVTDRNGKTRTLSAKPGASVMAIIRDSGFGDIQALCGGSCSCATCHVHVAPGFAALLPSMSEDENDLLGSSDHRTAGSRLACQIRFSDDLDGLALQVAPED